MSRQKTKGTKAVPQAMRQNSFYLYRHQPNQRSSVVKHPRQYYTKHCSSLELEHDSFFGRSRYSFAD